MQSIADYLTTKKIDLVINLPQRQRRFTPIITNGYLARRMAVELSIPLVTDVKCAKLLVKVGEDCRGWGSKVEVRVPAVGSEIKLRRLLTVEVKG